MATIQFSNSAWLVPALALLAIAAVALCVTYFKRDASALAPGQRRLSFVLKLAGFTLLALCLLQPEWTSERAEPGANLVAIIVDNSSGMNVRDSGEKKSRAALVAEELAKAENEKSSWLADLGGEFTVRNYTFDTRLQRVDHLASLTFDGNQSGLHQALAGTVARFKDRPLAAVVAITDGNATDAPPEDGSALDDSPPIYPVIVGKGAAERDLAIGDVSITQTVFEDAPITIRTEVNAVGCKGERLALRLLDQEGNELEKKELAVNTPEKRHTFRFLHRPKKPGVSFYKLAFTSETNPKTDDEATLVNNDRFITVNRGRGPYRVLYVSGRPNWEYKFLRRALHEDTEIEMPALIRIARREPKFEWRGRKGESSNPLFRGFQGEDGEEQQYDQPVLVRLRVEDEKELRDGFPRNEESCFRYHAIIIDDLEAEFFTVDQMELIREFVSRRGGGFLMLGGAECFHHGKFRNTPVGALLPVHLERPRSTTPAGELRYNLTREGYLEPWARLRESKPEEESRLASMTQFHSANLARALKPGASLIGSVFDGAENWPAIAVQRFGNGHVAAFTVGDVWRWAFKDPEQRADMEKYWRQLVRWLVADVPNRVSLKFQSDPESGTRDTARVEVRVLDETFRPLNEATVSLTITDPSGETITLSPRLSDKQPGLYEATFVSRNHSFYHAKAEARNPDATPIGDAEEGWTPNLAAEEFKELAPNRALLEEIAAKTGGEVYSFDELGKLASDLPESSVPITRTITKSLWHTPLVFILALVCFGAEWALRRLRGLA